MKWIWHLMALIALLTFCSGCIVEEHHGGGRDPYWHGYGHYEHWDGDHGH